MMSEKHSSATFISVSSATVFPAVLHYALLSTSWGEMCVAGQGSMVFGLWFVSPFCKPVMPMYSEVESIEVPCMKHKSDYMWDKMPKVLRRVQLLPIQQEQPFVRAVQDWLICYERKEQWPLPSILLCGSAFECKVWRMLRTVGWGETLSYGELARRIANEDDEAPQSVRAVARAVARNPLALLLPCHRILGATGQMTGYAWGIQRKIALLHHERSLLL